MKGRGAWPELLYNLLLSKGRLFRSQSDFLGDLGGDLFWSQSDFWSRSGIYESRTSRGQV